MKTKKRLLSVLLSLVLALSCFTALMNITAGADEIGNEVVYGIGGAKHQGTFVGSATAEDSDVFELHTITAEDGDTVSDYSQITVDRGKDNGRPNVMNTWHTTLPESSTVKRDGTFAENTKGINYFTLRNSYVQKKTVKEYSVVTMVRSFNKASSARIGFYSENGCVFGMYFTGQQDGGVAPYAFVSTPSQLWTEKKSSLYTGKVLYPNANTGHVLVKLRLEYSDEKLSSVSWTVDVYKSPNKGYESDGYTVLDTASVKYLEQHAIDRSGNEVTQISGTITSDMLENTYKAKLSEMKDSAEVTLNSDNAVPMFISGGPYSNNHFYQDLVECKYTLDYKKTAENLKEIYGIFENKKSLETALYFLHTYSECTEEIREECKNELSKIDGYIADSFSGSNVSVSQILEIYGNINGRAYKQILSEGALNAVNTAYDRLRPRADGASIKSNSEENISFYALRPAFFDGDKPSAENVAAVKAFGAVMDYYESVAATGNELTKENAAYKTEKKYSDGNKANIDADLNFSLDSSINVKFEEQWDTLISARFYVTYIVNGKEYTVYSNNEISNPVPVSDFTAGTCVRSVNGVMDSIISLIVKNYDKYKGYKGSAVKDSDGNTYDFYSAMALEDATCGNTEYVKETRTQTLYFLMSYENVVNSVNGLSAEGDPAVREDTDGPSGTQPEDNW